MAKMSFPPAPLVLANTCPLDSAWALGTVSHWDHWVTEDDSGPLLAFPCPWTLLSDGDTTPRQCSDSHSICLMHRHHKHHTHSGSAIHDPIILDTLASRPSLN